MVLGASMYESYFGNDMFDELAGIQPADYSDCETVAEACFRAMEEDAVNWANFDRALALNELNYLRENGEEIVYEEEDNRNLLQKGIDLIKSWFSKVMGAIQKFMSQVSAKLASATKWLGVNKKKLVSGMKWPEGKSFEDFDYKKGSVIKSDEKYNFLYANASDNPFSDMNDASDIEKINRDTTSRVNAKISGWISGNAMIGSGNGESSIVNVTVNDIKKNLIGEKKIKIDGSYMDSKTAANTITTFSDGIKAINVTKNDAKKVANQMIKNIKELEKKLKGNAGKDKDQKNKITQIAHIALKTVSKINAANSTLLTAKLIVMTGYLHQAQKIARIYLGQASSAEKDAKKAKREAEKNDKKNKKAAEAQNASALEDVLGFELV